jgi:rsbT co-antagonist protein RsbR
MADEVLHAVVREKARFLILDLTGVHVDEAATVRHLVQIVGAVGLLGARCVLSGIPAAMAASLVKLGTELDHIPVHSTLQRALEHVTRSV